MYLEYQTTGQVDRLQGSGLEQTLPPSSVDARYQGRQSPQNRIILLNFCQILAKSSDSEDSANELTFDCLPLSLK